MMKPISFSLAIVLMLSTWLWAQDIPIPYEHSFNSAPVEPIQFDFDIPDSSLADTANQHWLIYRDSSETVWNTAEYELLYSACSVFTFSSQINYTPPSNQLEWYIRSENDTAVISMSPKNRADQFPVPEHLLADLGADPAGDAENTSLNHQDITHCYASYSDTKLYFRMENNGGGYPTSSGLFTYFVYSVGVVDPNTTDSVAYALIYAEVPGIFSPGLYKVDGADSSFTQIGNINYLKDGNKLWMSCLITDLTSQPEWSDWLPPSQFIGVSAVTGTQEFTELTMNDMGKYAGFQPKSNYLDYSLANTSPGLSNVLVVQVEQDTVSAQVTYSDADDHLPVLRRLHFDGSVYDLTACEKDYQIGSQFEIVLTVPETGWYPYYFEFSDGADTVTTQLDSVYVEIVTYICGDTNGDELVDVSDAVYLINYAFGGGPAPDPVESGDVNCDSQTDVSDAVYIVNYAFQAGSPAPCDVDDDGIPDC